MTPLAYRIAKELTLPIKQRTFNDRGGLLKVMDDIHCFEVSEVMPLAKILKKSYPQHGIDERSAFLPAPKTWLEWRKGGNRFAALLIQNEDATSAKIYHVCDYRNDDCGGTKPGIINLSYRPVPAVLPKALEVRGWLAELDESIEETLALLAIINTPKIVGQKQHMPHRGLERRLVAQRAVIGKFPLHAWTEIKLNVHAPKDASGEDSQEAHYTGERALHFCRAHIRIRLGKLEIVRSHWRGDASLGIKQSRYKLTA